MARRCAPATGWFQLSDFPGTISPSAQRRRSSHHGVLTESLSAALSTSCSHFAHRVFIRAVIQSSVRIARCSSPSRQACSTSRRSENRRVKKGCCTEPRVVVRVVTSGRILACAAPTTRVNERNKNLGEAVKMIVIYWVKAAMTQTLVIPLDL